MNFFVFGMSTDLVRYYKSEFSTQEGTIFCCRFKYIIFFGILCLLDINLPVVAFGTAILQIVQDIQKLGRQGGTILHCGNVEHTISIGDSIDGTYNTSSTGTEYLMHNDENMIGEENHRNYYY